MGFHYEKLTLFSYAMFIIYSVLTTLQTYAFFKQRHRNILIYLFAISLHFYTIALLISTFNSLFFNQTKIGRTYLPPLADVFKLSALALFILFVLIIAKGWPITRPDVIGKPLIVFAWLGYLTIEILLYVYFRGINSVTSDPFTLPGWLSLSFRIVLMIWFLFELRSTMMLEQDKKKLRFYLHFGVGIMVWFIYLPIIILIGFKITLIWRYKLIIVFSLFVDFLAYAFMLNFLWPNKLTYKFLTQRSESDCLDRIEGENGSRDIFNCFSNTNFNGNNQPCDVSQIS